MDLLNFTANERIDYGDFQYAVNTVPTGRVPALPGPGVCGSAGQSWSVSGFALSITSGPFAVQVGDNITPNVAFLGQRSGASVTPDVLCVAGTASQSVALNTFAVGTYGVFVRFARNPGTAAQRVFWDGQNAREYTQLTNTRNIGQFEVRVESVAPSAEWLQIGSVTVSTAGTSGAATFSDTRPMYFEGVSSNSYAPTWGTTADRVATRLTKPIADLRTMIDALKAAIVDIKGPGLASWYSLNVQGLNIGTGFSGNTPTADRVNLGDLNFNLQRYLSGTKYFYAMNLGSNSFIRGDNSSSLSTILNINTTGSLYLGGGTVYLADNTYQNPIYPSCQVWGAGFVAPDNTRRTTGNSPSGVTSSSGVYTVTFGATPPTGAFVLTQPVSNDATATGYSSFGVISGNAMTVRISRGSATPATGIGFYYAIIYGP